MWLPVCPVCQNPDLVRIFKTSLHDNTGSLDGNFDYFALFDLFQSVDSVDLADAINKRSSTLIDIFLEVNTSFEQSKFGFSPEDIFAAVDSIQKMENLQISGLMTIGPLTDDRVVTRKSFALLRTIREKLNDRGYKKIQKLSMGMSSDYDMAIEEGSDIIRIGRAIFGDRNPKQ